MTPFSHLLHSIRLSHGVCQSELADLIGYEQTYISALETGRKGPPTQEFIERLIEGLNLSQDEGKCLCESAEASNRKLILDSDLPQDTYWLVSELRKNLRDLSPVQIRLIRDILSLKESINKQTEHPISQLRRRKSGEAHM